MQFACVSHAQQRRQAEPTERASDAARGRGNRKRIQRRRQRSCRRYAREGGKWLHSLWNPKPILAGPRGPLRTWPSRRRPCAIWHGGGEEGALDSKIIHIQQSICSGFAGQCRTFGQSDGDFMTSATKRSKNNNRYLLKFQWKSLVCCFLLFFKYCTTWLYSYVLKTAIIALTLATDTSEGHSNNTSTGSIYCRTFSPSSRRHCCFAMKETN